MESVSDIWKYIEIIYSDEGWSRSPILGAFRSAAATVFNVYTP